jgi:hypothetical protein
MRLQFLGCGDAFGSGGGFNTCFHVTTGVTQFLVDCGASMIAIRRFGVEPNAIETIFGSPRCTGSAGSKVRQTCRGHCQSDAVITTETID